MSRFTAACRRDDGGVPSTMIVIVLLFIFMELIIFTGRIAGARADVSAAAGDAARQASLAAGVDTVDDRIVEIAAETLNKRGLQCTTARAFLSEQSVLERGGIVAVEVICTVDVSDLGFLAKLAPTLSPTIDIRGMGFEGIDPLRVFEGVDIVEEQ